MGNMTLGAPRKDIGFIEQGINLTNSLKKKSVESTETVTQKHKKLRYFLKKHRDIIFKQTPSQVFKHSKLNKTKIEGNCITWTVQLNFMKGKDVHISAIVHNINENALIKSFVSSNHLKKEYISDEFSQFITEKVEFKEIQVKSIKTDYTSEEGEIVANKTMVVMQSIDPNTTLKDALKGQVVYEFPTLYV